jgi:hypothetical protein
MTLVGWLSLGLATTGDTGAADVTIGCVVDLGAELNLLLDGQSAEIDCANPVPMLTAVNLTDRAITLRGGSVVWQGEGRAFIVNDGGALTLDCVDLDFNGKPGIWLNAAGATLDITGGALRNGDDTNGGAILSSVAAEVRLSGATFSGNHANVDGGALKLQNLQVIDIEDCLFVANSGDRNGGAVHTDDSTMTLINSHFEDNIAEYGGHLFAETGSSWTLNDVDLVGGTAEVHGGQLFVRTSTLNVCGGLWEGGASGSRGGSLYLFDSVATIGVATCDATRFIGHRAVNGGAISADNTALSITNAVFEGSLATSIGGAIYAVNGPAMQVAGSTFVGNQAVTGGAIYGLNNDDDLPTTITGSAFYGNTAANGGGVAHVDSQVHIIDATFDGHVAGVGGSVHLDDAPLVATDTTFARGVAASRGGAIFAFDPSTVTLERVMVCDHDSGVGAAIDRTPGDDQHVIASHTAFVSNRGGAGGALALTRGELTDVDLLENHASSGAGLVTPNNVAVTRALIIGNVASLASSGAIDAPTLTANTSLFLDNLPNDASDPTFVGDVAQSGVLSPGCDGWSLWPRPAGAGARGGAAVGVDVDGDGADWVNDCDDRDASVQGPSPHYVDGDGDGLAGTAVNACPQRGLPTALEECDDLDGLATGGDWLFVDNDLDGVGAGEPVLSCAGVIAGYSVVGGDCDDTDDTVSAPVDHFVDGDGDGFGREPAGPACPALGLSTHDDDCDDDRADVAPGAAERCDGVDQDCDRIVDNDAVDALTLYVDGDDDGVGAGEPFAACVPPANSSLTGDDCDDADPDRAATCVPVGPDVITYVEGSPGCRCDHAAPSGLALVALFAGLGLVRRHPHRAAAVARGL